MLQTMFIEMTKRKTSIDVGKERKHLQKRFDFVSSYIAVSC